MKKCAMIAVFFSVFIFSASVFSQTVAVAPPAGLVVVGEESLVKEFAGEFASKMKIELGRSVFEREVRAEIKPDGMVILQGGRVDLGRGAIPETKDSGRGKFFINEKGEKTCEITSRDVKFTLILQPDRNLLFKGFGVREASFLDTKMERL